MIVHSPTPSPLVAYALDGLRQCWMPELGRYSHRYCFDTEAPNESVPPSDIFYTLNVLLGFSRLPEAVTRAEIDAAAVFEGCCRGAATVPLRVYGYGMALWAGAALGIAASGALADRVRTMLADDDVLARMTAQDLGMTIAGLTAQSTASAEWRVVADRLALRLRDRYHDPGSRLFYNQPTGLRRAFSSFASQVYSLLALYQYGETFSHDWAIGLANQAAAALIGLQGRRGEWGWFYYVPQRRVVDFYEVYSVHQHGMAPAFLHHAARHGVAGAREALVGGFNWLFGDNEMGVSMLRPAERMFYRSQLRRGELDGAWRRGLRSVANAALHRADAVERHSGLVLRRECRSYELGWILWSFGGRDDYSELTHRPEFSGPEFSGPEVTI
jgi:hypothetical protein